MPAITPGMIDTPLVMAELPEVHKDALINRLQLIKRQGTRADADRSRQIVERIPAGRWGEAADLAGAAVFLASRASDYVHGHVLVVDGGWMGR